MPDDYCLGFNIYNESVLLVKKNKPKWQAGRFNGIGGKREGSESFLDSMVREFREETGVETKHHEWKKIAFLWRHDRFYMHVFVRRAVLGDFKAINDSGEQNHELRISSVMAMDESLLLLNVKWMLSLADDPAIVAGTLHINAEYGGDPE